MWVIRDFPDFPMKMILFVVIRLLSWVTSVLVLGVYRFCWLVGSVLRRRCTCGL